jgi:hypothetical protein
MSDVVISFSVLNELNGSLKQIIVEFNEAGKNADALQDAVQKPCGKDDLHDRVHDFEDGWNNRREELQGDIEKVQQHVEEVGKKWAEWDLDASKNLELDGNEAPIVPSSKAGGGGGGGGY